MLTGSIIFRNSYGSAGYKVVGHDSILRCALSLHTTDMPSWYAMTSAEFIDTNPDINDRRVDIGSAKVKVEVEHYISKDTGKSVKGAINSDFFCRLGALVRYAKNQCNTVNEIGDYGMALASGEFEVVTERKYVIPTPDKLGVLAKITLKYDCIVSMELVTDSVEVRLEEDSSISPRQFYDIKNAWLSGIKFDEEYMGLPIPKQVIEDVYGEDGMYTCIEDIIKAHPEKEFDWLLGKQYEIVTDDTLEEIVDKIYNHNGYVFYDTETTGLNITFKSILDQADYITGVVLSVEDGVSYYFPLRMKRIENLCGGDHHYVMERYLRKILEEKELVAHNMTFDWKVGYIYDIHCNIVHDTMALFKLTIGAEYSDYPVALKALTRSLLRRDSLELSDLIIDNDWGETDITFADLPHELVRLYACADTDNTRGLLEYAIANDLLNKYRATKVYEIEIAFSYAVAYQEFYGHRVNTDNLAIIRKDIEEGQNKYMAKMVDLNNGVSFNPNSPKQLLSIMYGPRTEGGQGIPEQISRKTGRPTTDKATLKNLAEQTNVDGEPMYPFCLYMQKFREYEGVRKIIDKFPEHMTSDGYIFSEVQQYGTTTGRVSIKKPNYQSYNDAIKKHIVPRPDCWMFDTDYSSVEYRVLGSMVLNRPIMHSFEDPDFDYHAYQAAHMNRIPYSAVTKKIRKAAKSINFGLPYGMGDASLGATIFGEVTDKNTAEAKRLREAYFKGQEDIRDWFEQHRNKGVREGFTETYFGRRRYYRKDKFNDAAIRRQAGNQVIQGTAADIYKLAVGNVFKRIVKEGWLGKVFLTGFIHDELLGEVSNEINPTVFLKMLREEFEVKVDSDKRDPVTGKFIPWCPLYMGFGYGTCWYEAKSVELPIMMQKELVKKYGVDGIPTWNGNPREFCDTVPDMLRSFSIRDTFRQLREPDDQDKEVKPALDTAIMAVLKDDKKEYPQAKAYFDEHGEWSDAWYIKGIVDDINITTDTQANIDMLCILHDETREDINVHNIQEHIATESNSDNEVDMDKFNSTSGEFDEDEEQVELAKKAKIDEELVQFGMYVDVQEGYVIFDLNEKTYPIVGKAVASWGLKGELEVRLRKGDEVTLAMKDGVKLYTTTKMAGLLRVELLTTISN